MHAAYVTHVHYTSTYESTSEAVFFAAKSENSFQDVIMLIIFKIDAKLKIDLYIHKKSH